MPACRGMKRARVAAVAEVGRRRGRAEARAVPVVADKVERVKAGAGDREGRRRERGRIGRALVVKREGLVEAAGRVGAGLVFLRRDPAGRGGEAKAEKAEPPGSEGVSGGWWMRKRN